MVYNSRESLKKYFRKKSLILYSILILILFSINVNYFGYSPINNSIATTTWTQSSPLDFDNSTLENLVITSSGKIALDYQIKSIEDNFIDESKISYRKNLTWDQNFEEISLSEIDNVFFSTMGMSGDEISYSLDKTSDGGYAIIGSRYRYKDTDSVIIYKVDKSGKMQWNKTYGGSGHDYGRSGHQTLDGGYIIGGSTSSYGAGNYDLWLVKTDSFGNMEWNKTYGGSKWDTGRSVVQTSDGGFILLGYCGSFDSGNGFWLIKTYPNGTEMWNKTYDSTNSQYGIYVEETSDNGFIISGMIKSGSLNNDYDIYLKKTDENGTEEWSNSFGTSRDEMGFQVRETVEGGFIVLGSTDSYNPDVPESIRLIKTNETGIMEWEKELGDNKRIYFGYSLQQTSDGGYIVTGTILDSSDNSRQALLIKTDSSGKIEWENNYGGKNYDSGYSVLEDSDGSYVVAGNADPTDNNDLDILLFKTNGTGACKLIGELCSKDILDGQKVKSLTDFVVDANIPGGSAIEIQFSNNKKEWYNSKGILNEWDDLKENNGTFYLNTLNWQGPEFYYMLKFYSYSDALPVLNRIKLTYQQYYLEGKLESQPYDNGNSSSWKNLNWLEEKTKGTSIKFQIRTGSSLQDLLLQKFLGPNGNIDEYYLAQNETIWSGHETDNWIQYVAFLSTTDPSHTPILIEVSITKNVLPKIPSLNEPLNNTWISDNKPCFTWTYFDPDSNSQYGFQFQADDNINFTSINYKNQYNEIESGATSYCPSYNISDGVWYWRIRTQDSDHDWSLYSDFWILKIDTSPPKISHTPVTSTSEGDELLINTEVTDKHSGIQEVILYYKNIEDIDYNELKMNKDENIYCAKILVEIGESEEIEYYLKAIDKSSPANSIYYGLEGETTIKPSSSDDLNIKVLPQTAILAKSPIGHNVTVTTKIEITFSKNMSINETMEAFSIYPFVDGKFIWQTKNKLEFEPLEPLEYNTTYNVKISKSAYYDDGSAIFRNHEWEFTTEKGEEETPKVSSDPKVTKNNSILSNLWIIIVSLIIIFILIIIIIFYYFSKKKSKGKSIFTKSRAVKPIVSHQSPSIQDQSKILIQPPTTPQQMSPIIQPPPIQPLIQQNFSVPSKQQLSCVTCGNQLTYINQNGKYYCHQCQKYQ